jgi:hypothetical protein
VPAISPGLAELEDAVHNTIFGDDINMMSKGDW